MASVVRSKAMNFSRTNLVVLLLFLVFRIKYWFCNMFFLYVVLRVSIISMNKREMVNVFTVFTFVSVCILLFYLFRL